MSDLSNLFSQKRKPDTPVKRLFVDELSTSKKRAQTRSRQPNKSIRKKAYEHHNNVSLLKSKDFAKRHIQKSDIKKEILHYNQQVLLVFIRKMFFVMGGVILLNTIFTSAHQSTILCNMMLALFFVDINLEDELIRKSWFKGGKEFARILSYCINFYLLFLEIHPERSISNGFEAETLLISGNAVLNYIILSFCKPFASIERIRNYRLPYVSPFERLKLQMTEFWHSLSILYCFYRPILLSNLVYWLFVVFYIIYERSQTLLNNLLTLQTLLTFLLTTFFLYLYMYLIEKVNIAISIQLLSANKKALNISILRLDSQKRENEEMIKEIMKYIWKNPELMWDIEFFSHLYSINYDILEDYLNLQLRTINQKILQVIRFTESEAKNKQKQQNKLFSLALRVKSNLSQINTVHRFASFITNRQYIFYVIQQIAYFQSFSNEFPINVQSLLKKIIKIDSSLKLLSENIKFLELKQSICHFHTYFTQKILSPFIQS